MIFYSVFFLIEVTLLSIASLTRSRIFFITAALLAIFFAGFRYETGYDYNSYKSFFENLDYFDGVLEPGFYFFVYGAVSLGISASFLFFIFSFATHGLAFAFIRRATNTPHLALLVYLLIPGLYLNSFSIVRQALAVSIFAWAAYRLITRHRKIEFLLLGILAASFHLPAIIPFIIGGAIYSVPHSNPGKFTSFIFLLSSLALSFVPVAQIMLGFFVETKYAFYLDDQTSQSSVKIILMLLLACVVIWHSDHFYKSSTLAYFYKLWFVGILLFNMFSSITPLTRINYYFQMVAIPLFVAIPLMYKGANRAFFNTALILFFTFAFVGALYKDTLVDNQINMLNYKHIFEAR